MGKGEVMVVALPRLTDEQRAAAIEKSARVRQVRAELREQLRSGKIALSEAIERGRNDEILGKMRVTALLESLPGVGRVRAQNAMTEAGISQARRIRGLGPNQIESLTKRFG